MDVVKLTTDAVSKRLSFFQTNNEAVFDKKINIGFGVDAAYVRPMAVTITSLVVNNPGILFNIHVFLGSIEQNDIAKIEELTKQYPNLTITLYDVDQEKFAMLPTSAAFSLPIYFRIMMPAILSHLDFLLYLDADIVCLNPIDEIFSFDTGNMPAAVVADCDDMADDLSREDFDAGNDCGKYFCSGVILINIKKWNEQNILQKTFDILLKGMAGSNLFDQDALNAVLKDNVKYLPRRWNYIQRRKNKNDVPKGVIILHSPDNPKPWKNCCSDQDKVRRYYLQYERLSPWKDVPPEPPRNYRDARILARLLFSKGNIFEGIKWFMKYRAMKRKTKK